MALVAGGWLAGRWCLCCCLPFAPTVPHCHTLNLHSIVAFKIKIMRAKETTKKETMTLRCSGGTLLTGSQSSVCFPSSSSSSFFLHGHALPYPRFLSSFSQCIFCGSASALSVGRSVAIFLVVVSLLALSLSRAFCLSPSSILLRRPVHTPPHTFHSLLEQPRQSLFISTFRGGALARASRACCHGAGVRSATHHASLRRESAPNPAP